MGEAEMAETRRLKLMPFEMSLLRLNLELGAVPPSRYRLCAGTRPLPTGKF